MKKAGHIALAALMLLGTYFLANELIIKSFNRLSNCYFSSDVVCDRTPVNVAIVLTGLLSAVLGIWILVKLLKVMTTKQVIVGSVIFTLFLFVNLKITYGRLEVLTGTKGVYNASPGAFYGRDFYFELFNNYGKLLAALISGTVMAFGFKAPKR